MKPFPWKCGACRQRGLVPAVIDYQVELTHDGRAYPMNLPALNVFRCELCGAIVLDNAADKKISDALRAAAGLLSPEDIRRGREKLGLTQKQLAHYLQVGEATLSRWETGAQIQQRAMDRLLRVYFQVPEARYFIETTAQGCSASLQMPETPMKFITYENRRNPRLTIHLAGCSQIAKRGGEHKYGQGEYKDHTRYSEAQNYAAQTGLPVKECSFCKPDDSNEPRPTKPRQQGLRNYGGTSMRIYITHCSATKDVSLQSSGLRVTPDCLYTATPTRRFMERCKATRVDWAIFSDQYGVWFPHVKHEWYEKDPDTVTDSEFCVLLRDFDESLSKYDEILFYRNPGRFNALYGRLVKESNLGSKLSLFSHLNEIR
jgi:putative zinc finger/helix-turn-helix YgiT family protein